MRPGALVNARSASSADAHPGRQAPNIKDAKILLAAASIVTIEARHSGAIGSIVDKAINPNGAFDTGLSASAILKAVTGTHFIA